MIPTVTIPMNMTSRGSLTTFLSMIIEGKDSAVTDIMKACVVLSFIWLIVLVVAATTKSNMQKFLWTIFWIIGNNDLTGPIPFEHGLITPLDYLGLGLV